MQPKVMVADDDAMFRMVLNRILVRTLEIDAQIIEASDGRAALQLFHEDAEFSLICLDWDMPFMDGPELARAIREHDRNVPILMNSGYRRLDEIAFATEAGVDRFLRKDESSDIWQEQLASAVQELTDLL